MRVLVLPLARQRARAREHDRAAVVLAKGKALERVDLPAQVIGRSPADADGPDKTIVKNEARLMREVLEECNWNKTLAANRLGISRSTLYEKIKKYSLHPPTVH